VSEQKEYLLGVNPVELDRLRFQHSVWKGVTDRFFDRLGVGKGWKCLDVGAGPGFVAIDLRERVGAGGEVVALEPSEMYLHHFGEEVRRRGWSNVHCVQGTAETASLPPHSFDLVFARWVIGFVPDPERFLTQLFATLRPGGVIALQDYVYEGLSLHPMGGPFDQMADAVRAYWRIGGGDPYIAARIPHFFRKHGLHLVDYTPTCLAGGPDSAVFEWAHRFFQAHTQVMVDKGIVTQAKGDAMWSDWLTHKANPDTVFISPIVVDMAGKVE
jgi:SAM-dependent methyltransferase